MPYCGGRGIAVLRHVILLWMPQWLSWVATVAVLWPLLLGSRTTPLPPASQIFPTPVGKHEQVTCPSAQKRDISTPNLWLQQNWHQIKLGPKSIWCLSGKGALVTGQSKEACLKTLMPAPRSGPHFFQKNYPHDTYLKMIIALWGSF